MKRLFLSAALLGILIGVVFGFLPGSPTGQMPDDSPKFPTCAVQSQSIIASSTAETPHYFILIRQDEFDGPEYSEFLAENFSA